MHVRLDFLFSFRSVLIVLIFCLPFNIPQMESHADTFFFHLIVSLFFNFLFSTSWNRFSRAACKYLCKIAIGILCLIFRFVYIFPPKRSAWTNVCACDGAKSHQLSSLHAGILISVLSHKCAFSRELSVLFAASNCTQFYALIIV